MKSTLLLLTVLKQTISERVASYFSASDMKVLVGGVKKDLYDRFDVHQLLSDNRLLDEQIVEDILEII